MSTGDLTISKVQDEVTVGEVYKSIEQVVASDKWQDISDAIIMLEQQSPNVRRLLFTRARLLLHLAVRESTGRFLEYLLETAANNPSLQLDIDTHVNIRVTRLSTPLWAAVATKKPCAVNNLLRYGADVNFECHDASPLLACLQTSGSTQTTVEIAEVLLKYGADVTYANSKGVTPLMLAARNHPQLVDTILKTLRDAGNDTIINVRDRDGRTALHYATCSKQLDNNVIASLCHQGGEVFALDYEGRDVLMACCAYIGMSEWTPSRLWFRIGELMKAFCTPLTKQWQVWELVGAEVALWACWPHYDIEVESSEEITYDHVFFWEQALSARQQLQAKNIPAIPQLFVGSIYEEPMKLEALYQFRNDWVSALVHAVQVKRRHLGDNSLAVTKAYGCCFSYVQKELNADPADKETQKEIFAYCARGRLEALSLRAKKSKLLRLLEDNEISKSLFEQWIYRLTNHLGLADALTCHVYCRSEHMPDTVWGDLMLMMEAAVDLITLPVIHPLEPNSHHTFLHLLLMATSHLGCTDNRRKIALQLVVNSLAEKCSVFIQLFQDSIIEKQWHTGINQWHHSSYLPLACVQMIVKGARISGVSFNACQQVGAHLIEAPLFLCARLIDNPQTTDERRAELKCIMEMLVDDGGAHWDATDARGASTCTVVSYFDHATVARYTNLQCLAARVVRHHMTDYKYSNMHSAELEFVNLH